MGDILHALPAVTALRQSHAGWVIDWVVEPCWRALLSAHESPGTEFRTAAQPLVDRLHLAPTKAWRRDPLSRKTVHEISVLRGELKRGEYDAVLDLQGAVRSAIVGRLTGCSRRIGEWAPRESAARWLLERYAAVASDLASRGFRVLANAGPGEEPLATTVQDQSGGTATPVTCSLAQLIALTRRVALVIAGDTGPLHLACALGRPVVGIYGPTAPPRTGPFGTRFRVLRSPESRRDHPRHEAPEAGLLTISPQDVIWAANDLLAEETFA